MANASPPTRRPIAILLRAREWLLGLWIRPTVLGTDALVECAASSSAVCYVLAHPASTDVTLLSLICARYGLPDPSSCVLGSERYTPAWCAMAGRVGGPLKRVAAVAYPALLNQAVNAAQAGDSVVVVPVFMLWGRAPGKEKSLLRLFFSERWSITGRFRRALSIVVARHDILIQFGEPMALQPLVKGMPERQAVRRAARVLRIALRQQRRAALGPDLSHRRTLLTSVLVAPQVRTALHAAVASGEPHDAALERATRYAEEIASDMSYPVIRFFDLLLTRLWQRIYEGVDVHGVEAVQALAGTHALVYLPSHRSHMDYLLLSYVLHYRGLMIPHIAAGVNLNLPLVGSLLRRAGAFFIRRSFRDDPLYTAVIAEYLWLVCARGHSLEYFIEGSRSRTGRLLYPRPGLLAMTIDALQRGVERPVALVPVYFGYERLMEDRSYLTELRGGAKRSESLLDIVRTGARLTRSFGRVAVNFAPPMELAPYLDRRCPDWREADLKDESHRQLVPELGHDILTRVNQRANFNSHNLVALCVLATPRNVIDRELLVQQVDLYLSLLKHAPESAYTFQIDSGEHAVSRAEDMQTLQRVDDPLGVLLKYRGDLAVLHHWYRNNALHALAMPALMTALVLSRPYVHLEWAMERVRRVYPFLANELHLPNDENDTSAFAWLAVLKDQRILHERHRDAEASATISGPSLMTREHGQATLLARVIMPTLERYYTTIAVLRSRPSGTFSRDQLAAACEQVVHRLITLQGTDSPEFHDRALFHMFIAMLIKEHWINLDDAEQLRYDNLMSIAVREASAVVGSDVRHAVWQLRRPLTDVAVRSE